MKRVTSFFKDLYAIYMDVCVDNRDGCAKARRSMLITTYLTTVCTSLTTGAFFTAFLLALGADDVYIGYVTMATSFCAIVQFLSPLLWERIPKRKPLIVTFSVICNFSTYVVITVIPLLPVDNSIKLGLYFAATLVTAVLSNFSSPASSAWTMQSIPLEKRVNNTTLSTLPNTIINIVTAFLGGVLLDRVKLSGYAWGEMTPELTGVLLLRFCALIPVAFSTVINPLFVKEFPYEQNPEKKNSLKLLILPLLNRPYLGSILIPCLWAFISGIIGNYFTLHLTENVHMSYTLINMAQMISTPLVLTLTPIWAVILNKKSWVKTLAVAMLGYSLAYYTNVFISETTQWVYFLCIVMGHLTNPCITMVMNNLIYLKMPEQDRTAFFSFYAIASSLCTFLGQTVGTLFVKYSEDLRFTLFGVEICNLQLTSGIAAVLVFPLAVYAYIYGCRLEAEKRSLAQK